MKTTLILVGGFLGAGKTTLLAQATRRLLDRGVRVGLITNDQAGNLVDTAMLQATGAPVGEVAGGCFCCRFDSLLTVVGQMLDQEHPQVLLGEPVGSCTDLSATVLQPAKEQAGGRFRVAPFSVLVDVRQVRSLESLRTSLQEDHPARFPDNVMYIYQKQLEEADLIVLNKTDLVSAEELARIEETLRRTFPQAPVVTTSARDGRGVDAWLDRALAEDPAGRTIVEVDYDQYAAGEAALGWLNAAVRLEARCPTDWQAFCLALVEGLQDDFRRLAAEVAHLKFCLIVDQQRLVVNLTNHRDVPSLRGAASIPATEARLLVNARMHLDPERLRAIVENRLTSTAGEGVQIGFDAFQCFAPGRPQPAHRYASVVETPCCRTDD